MAERESRQWWIVNDGEVAERVGYSCAPHHPDMWWVPSIGCSMGEGFGAFATRAEAVTKARAGLQADQKTIERKLAALEQS